MARFLHPSGHKKATMTVNDVHYKVIDGVVELPEHVGQAEGLRRAPDKAAAAPATQPGKQRGRPPGSGKKEDKAAEPESDGVDDDADDDDVDEDIKA